MKAFRMKDIFQEEDCIGGKANGRFFYNEVEIALSKGPVVVDFEGVQLITQSFSDEFLGPVVIHHGVKVFEKVTFKGCSQDIKDILISTAQRFAADTQTVS